MQKVLFVYLLTPQQNFKLVPQRVEAEFPLLHKAWKLYLQSKYSIYPDLWECATSHIYQPVYRLHFAVHCCVFSARIILMNTAWVTSRISFEPKQEGGTDWLCKCLSSWATLRPWFPRIGLTLPAYGKQRISSLFYFQTVVFFFFFALFIKLLLSQTHIFFFFFHLFPPPSCWGSGMRAAVW